MAHFLDPKELNNQLCALFEEAQDFIFIVCPYIKLPVQLKKVLNRKMEQSKFQLILIYGKNEDDPSKSLSEDDFIFLKKFKNLDVRYYPNLHAKYYANESASIVTSLNLHDFSMKNNIEVGVLFQRTRFGIKKDNTEDSRAFSFFEELQENSYPVFEQGILEKKVFFGLFKKQVGHKVFKDNTQDFFEDGHPRMGFCIRTGVKIKFNLEMPFSQNAFEIWSQYSDINYPENYCHFSGEKSQRKTSFAKPVLKKNWRLAMEIFGGKY